MKIIQAKVTTLKKFFSFNCLIIFFITIVFATGCSKTVETIAPAKPTHTSWYSDPQINETIIIAWDHARNGRYDEAINDFNRLIAKGFDHYDILFGSGFCEERSGNPKKAITLLSKCLEKNPIHSGAFMIRAQAFGALHNTVAQKKDLQALADFSIISAYICGLYPGDKADSAVIKVHINTAREMLNGL